MPDGVSEILRFVEGWGRRAYPVPWSVRDTITYAIATGADAHNGRALVWESAPGFGTLATFATRFAHEALVDFATGTRHAGLLSFARATRVRVHRPLAAECGDAVASASLAVAERTAGRLVLRLDVETSAGGEPIADSSLDVHFRLPAADGARRPPTAARDGADGDTGWRVEARETVHPYQAAVFRTLLGLTADGRVQDVMHIDPAESRRLGLPAPALPGEVTLGIVARLAVQNAARLGVGELRGAAVSYLKPVADADRLVLGFAPAGGGTVRARAVNGDGRVALRGELHFHPDPARCEAS
ncbi:MaoC family dehydratase [Actinomadura chokoriensis]|uniref:MaoC family dehydratase n=1 Tax=Actinomadura chokoriensis TaxID=454156 RepID=A0ABV4QVR1_9ACTN